MTKSPRALDNRQIARAALVVLLGFLASGVLGIVRTAVIAGTFGASDALDAFYAAQRIPETLFNLVAGGALGSAFIPVFTRLLGDDTDGDAAWRLASATMTLSALAAGVLAVLAWIAAPLYVPIIIAPPSVGAEVQALTIRLLRVMLVTPVIFSISGLLMGVLNAHQNFTLPALAISMNNVGLIVGALVLARLMPTTDGSVNIFGLAWGAVLAACLHLAIQLPGLRGIRARLRLLFDPSTNGVGEVLRLMLPRVLGLAVVQINFLVNARLALPMAEGSNVALTTAFSLMFFALGVIAQSVGTALFPTLSALAADGDTDGFRDRLSAAMRSVLFLAIPATFVMILLGEPLVALIAQRGAWTPQATQATAWALAFFAIGVAGHSLLEVLARAFYALSDTWTPVWVGVLAMLANIVLSLVFIRFIGDPDNVARGAFGGLALANSVTTLVESATLWWLLSRRLKGIGDRRVLDGVWRTLAAALVMSAGLWVVNVVMGEAWALWHALAGGVVGAVLFFGVAWALRMDEASTVPRLVLARLRR